MSKTNNSYLQQYKNKYTLAGDLIVLATKAFNNGDQVSAAKLFCQACTSKDLKSFVQSTLAIELSANNIDKSVLIPIINNRTIQAFATEIKNSSVFTMAEVKKGISLIKTIASSGSDITDGDTESSLDMEDADTVEDEQPAEDDDDELDFEQDGEDEVELSSDRTNPDLRDVRRALYSLKMGDISEIKKYTPILLSMFPDLVVHTNVTKQRDIRQAVLAVINRLNMLSNSKLKELRQSLSSLIDNIQD